MDQNMNIPPDGIELIKKFEEFRGTAYKCPAGVWTIGYGTTQNVKEGQKISEFDASTKLHKWLIDQGKTVKKLIHTDINNRQYTAIMSFVYNLGVSAFASSTLLKKINEGDYKGAGDEFLRWTKATINGEKKVLPGLVKRRKVERLVFLNGNPAMPIDRYYDLFYM